MSMLILIILYLFVLVLNLAAWLYAKVQYIWNILRWISTWISFWVIFILLFANLLESDILAASLTLPLGQLYEKLGLRNFISLKASVCFRKIEIFPNSSQWYPDNSSKLIAKASNCNNSTNDENSTNTKLYHILYLITTKCFKILYHLIKLCK